MTNDIKKYTFCVAGFAFSIWLPYRWNINLLLPSFQPFRYEGEKKAEEALFSVEITDRPAGTDHTVKQLLEDTINDMGHVRLFAVCSGYRIEVSALKDNKVHVMCIDKGFTSAVIQVCDNDKNKASAIGSMLRMMYAQAILRKNAISVHAAAVYMGGMTYMFMGKSGTGKSTHASLWTHTFKECHLLNDDNPVVRIEHGQAWVYGTPWSGKTPCYRNMGFPLAGAVRLKQAGTNRFSLLEDTEAFIALLPACSVIRKDSSLHDCMCDTLVRLTGLCRIGMLECLPEEEAATLCAISLNVPEKFFEHKK